MSLSRLQRIDFNHVLQWIYSLFFDVGATTGPRFLIRSDTTKFVWLAPNGSDSNTGLTAGDPVLTLGKAYAQIHNNPTRTTIHIIRNGYVGDITFDGGFVSIFTEHDRGIQTEQGTIASIEFVTGDTSLSDRFSFFNGIRFVWNLDIDSQAVIVQNPSDDMVFWFCSFVNGPLRKRMLRMDVPIGSSEPETFLVFNTTSNICSLGNCLFDGRISNPDSLVKANETAFSCNTGSGALVSIDHCLFINYDNPFIEKIGPLYTQNPAVIWMSAGSTNAITVAIGRSTFYKCTTLSNLHTNVASALTMEFSIISLCSYLSTMDSSFNNTYTIQTSLIDLLSKTIGVQSVTYTDTIDTTDPLFVDPLAGNFTLQDKRKLIPGTLAHYLFTSLAVQNTTTDFAGNDLAWGAYQFLYTLTEDSWESVVWDNEFWNDTCNIEYDLVNHQSFNDPRANFHRTYDGSKRKITFTTLPNNWTGTRDSYRLKHLIESEGAKRWYPRGDEGVAYNSTLAPLSENPDGTFSYTLPTGSSIHPSRLTPNAFRGMVAAVISSGAVSSGALRVKAHTKTLFTLEDHRGDQNIAEDDYTLRLLYYPVEIDQPQTSMIFENWNPQANPLMEPIEVDSGEGNIKTLTVREVELDI